MTTGPPTALTVPDSFWRYKRQTGNVSRRLLEEMRHQMRGTGPLGALMAEKIKAAYYTDGDSQLTFMGMQGADIPELGAELKRRSPSSVVDSFLQTKGISDAHDYQTGPHEGALRCGRATIQGVQASVRAWADSSVVGLLIGPKMLPWELGPLTLALRYAAEH